MRRRLTVWALLGLLAGALGAAPDAAAGSAADLQIDLQVYKGDRSTDRVHDGPLVIGREYTFVFKVRNEGPSRTRATLRWQVSPTSRDARYDWWSIPGELDGWIVYDDATGCSGRRCTVGVGPGQEKWVTGVFIDANAPGAVTVSGRVSSDLSDPDPSDNRATISRAVSCSINGTAGADRLRGTSDRDSICGRGGNDRIVGIGPGDKIFGGDGNDVMKGDRAQQMFVGGPGVDTISYKNAQSMVFIFLKEMVSNGWARDYLIKPEVVIGSRYADYMEGSRRGERIEGWRGNDEIFGDAGRDTLSGGRGSDEFDSNDGVRDLIKGGGGYDVAHTDGRDVRRSAAYSSYRTFPDRS